MSGAGLAANSSLGVAVLFGGTASSGLSNATALYSFSSDRWRIIAPAGTTPSARTGMAFSSDSSPSGIAPLFGGETSLNPVTVVNTTYAFHFATDTWSRAPAGKAPGARADPAFAVDPKDGVGLLFGGWNPGFNGVNELTYADTWELNLSTLHWSNLTKAGAVSPPPSRGARLAWDSAAKSFILVGGCYPCSSAVWRFDLGAGVWSQLAAAPGGPTPRMESVWSWDPEQDVGLLFGGTDGTQWFNDTYAFSLANDTWTPVVRSVAPAPRALASSDWLDVRNNATLLVTGGNESQGPAPDAWRLSATANLTVQVQSSGAPGAAVPGAYVSLGPAAKPGASAVTNSSGNAFLAGVPANRTVMNVSAPGFAPVGETIWIPSGAQLVINVSLSPIPPGNVHVQVADASGAPIQGASVDLLVRGVLVVAPPMLTDGTGWANYTNVPAASVATIVVNDSSYHTASIPAVFPSSANASYNITLTPLATLDVLALGISQGAAVPLVGVQVFLNSSQLGNTTGRGWLNISVTASGPVALKGTVTGFSPGFANATIPYSGTREVTLTLLGLPLGVLRLHVIDALNSTPLSNANATVLNAGPIAIGGVNVDEKANATGWIVFALVEGPYVFNAGAPGYSSFFGATPIQITSGVTNTTTVPLFPNFEATIHFFVTDRNTSAPIANASVLVESRLSGLTNRNGWLNLTDLPPGNDSVTVSATGYLSNLTRGDFVAGELDLRFQVNLTALPVTAKGQQSGANQTGLSFELSGTFPLWELLLVPALVAGAAALYLLVLRLPSVPGLAPASARPRNAENRPKSP